MSEPNMEELLKSPYDDDHSNSSDEIQWKLPVGASIVGALAMALFVVVSLATAPDVDPETTATTAQGGSAEPIEATDFPEGYASVSDGVAMRVDLMRTDGETTTLFVSSVVKGDTDAESVTAVDIMAWTVRSGGSEPSMHHQHTSRTALGGITVELSPVFDPQNAVAVATLPGVSESVTDVLSLPPEVPTVVRDHRIAVGNAVVVIDELAVGNGYGSIQWHLQGGLAARVDVVVTFDGVELPLVLVTTPRYNPETGNRGYHLPALWNPAGTVTLVRDGEPLSGSNVPTGITVTFDVSVVTEAGEDIEIPIGGIVQD